MMVRPETTAPVVPVHTEDGHELAEFTVYRDGVPWRVSADLGRLELIMWRE